MAHACSERIKTTANYSCVARQPDATGARRRDTARLRAATFRACHCRPARPAAPLSSRERRPAQAEASSWPASAVWSVDSPVISPLRASMPDTTPMIVEDASWTSVATDEV